MLEHEEHASAINGDRKKGPSTHPLDVPTLPSINVQPCLSSHVFTKNELSNKGFCNKDSLFSLKVLLNVVTFSDRCYIVLPSV